MFEQGATCGCFVSCPTASCPSAGIPDTQSSQGEEQEPVKDEWDSVLETQRQRDSTVVSAYGAICIPMTLLLLLRQENGLVDGLLAWRLLWTNYGLP